MGFPRSPIRIFIQILQADGGHVAAAGIPMRDLVSACCTGMLVGRPALDLSREEENAGGAQVLAAALASSEKVLLLEVESKVPEGQFEPLYSMAVAGCRKIADEMRTCLLEHATQHFSLRLSLRSGQ